jgi:hypothetical protein
MALFESVRVPIGSVLTDAKVFSNEGVLIFHSVDVSVVESDEFTVSLRPEAVAPVLQVCIPEDDQRLVIKNQGTSPLIWELRPQGDLGCSSNNPSCLSFTPSSGTTSDSVAVTFDVNTAAPHSFDVLVWTKQGTIGITIDPVLSTYVFRSDELSVF